MSSTSNHYYGNDEVLARWAGLDRGPRPIAGILQHGWMPWYPWRNTGELLLARQPSFVPRFVWSKADERAVRSAGRPRVHAIGAPFLYLQGMLPEPEPPPLNRLVALAFHTDPSASADPRWEPYAEWLEGLRSEYEPIEVSLHPHDYSNPAARAAFERRGLGTFTNGPRDDPRFLWRLDEQLRSAAAVTTPRLGTGLICAAALGRRVFLGGPIGVVLSTRLGGEVTGDLERAERFQRERYPQLFDGIEGEEARSWGRKMLGADFLQPPDRLARILGWRGPRRPLAWALSAGANVNRALRRGG